MRRCELLFDQMHDQAQPERVFRSFRLVSLAGLGVLVLGAVVFLTPWGCESTVPVPSAPSVSIDQLKNEPAVRVRVGRGKSRIKISSQSPMSVGLGTGQLADRSTSLTITWSKSHRLLVIERPRGTAVDSKRLHIRTSNNAPLRIDGVENPGPYPGSIVVQVCSDGSGFDVINHVRMEQYLPGVLDRELFRHWHPVTFQAQAIAARSYAIAELGRTRRRHFDLETDEASQVYGGLTTNTKARDAVRHTKGMVLVFDGEVVCAYYSSTSGGTGQDAAIVFPQAKDIPPLRGRDHGSWGRASRYYRWGPIRRNLGTLSYRLAAWGKAHHYPIADLGRIKRIKISRLNAAGRPAEFRIRDRSGRSFHLGPESFRFACNFTGGKKKSIPLLTADTKLRSSHVDVRIGDQNVLFTDGRGFGHGVGMGQYGAQAMAKRGHDAQSILAFYYPQSEVLKVY